MVGPNARIGLGATIEFLTSGIELQITKATWTPGSRSKIETAHLGTPKAGLGKHGSRTSIPGKLVDPGMLKLECHANPAAVALLESDIERVRLTLALEADQSTPDAFEADGYVLNIDGVDLDPDGKIPMSIDVVLSGEVDDSLAS